MGRTARKRLKKRFQSRPVNIGTNPEFIQLCKWMTEHKWQAEAKLTPAIFNETGRGLMSLDSIRENSLIVKIPLSLLITRKSVLEEIPQLEDKHLSAAELLSFYLLFCKTNQSNTIYLSTLPRQFSVGVLCSNEESAHLPEYLQHFITFHQDYVQAKFQKMALIWKDLFNRELDFDLFKWAWFCVNSRAVFYQDRSNKTSNMPAEESMALAPFLDLLNHSQSAQIEAKFNPSSNCYEIKTLKKISKFQQVFINYGPHSNEKLFLEYGFIITSNVNSFVKFSLESILDLLALPSPSPKKLRFINLLLIKNQQLFVCTREGFGYDTEIMFALLCLEECDLSLYSSTNPYEINHDEFPVRQMGARFLLALSLQLEEMLRKAENINHPVSQSFEVAKQLMADWIDIVQCAQNCISNDT